MCYPLGKKIKENILYTKLTIEDFLTMEKGVVSFNEKMGNSLEDDTLIPTYHALSKEEICGELLEAIKADDKVEILDALIDGVFVVFYWALLSNKTFTLTNAISWIDSYLDKEDQGESVDGTIEALESCILTGYAYGAQSNLVPLIISYQDQFDIMGAYKEVLRSNLSKFKPKGSTDIEKELKLIEEQVRYGDITVEEISAEGGEFITFKAGRDIKNNVTYGAPKIIKPSSFSEPNLLPFIY